MSSLKKYLHMIRNIKTLDKEMIDNVQKMTHDEKLQIIIALNEVIECIKYLIE